MSPILLAGLLSAVLLYGGVRSSEAADKLIYDVDGNALRSGREYYIFPASSSTSAATLSTRNSSACPANVAMDMFRQPTPVRVRSAANPISGFVRPWEDVRLEFADAHSCVESRVWALQSLDGATRVVVKWSGMEGPTVVRGRFQIAVPWPGTAGPRKYVMRARAGEDDAWADVGLNYEKNDGLGYLGLQRTGTAFSKVELAFRKAESATDI